MPAVPGAWRSPPTGTGRAAEESRLEGGGRSLRTATHQPYSHPAGRPGNISLLAAGSFAEDFAEAAGTADRGVPGGDFLPLLQPGATGQARDPGMPGDRLPRTRSAAGTGPYSARSENGGAGHDE